MDYTTDSSHLLLNNLYPNRQYTFRVAAYTNERGPFSQLTTKTLGQQSPTGMLSLILFSVVFRLSMSTDTNRLH